LQASLCLHLILLLMKVTDHIAQAKGTLISFEVLPPLKGKGIEALYRHLDPLMEFNPAYINVTYHRSEHVFKKKADGSFDKVVVRKRPGTEAICAAIMNKYNVDTVPHLICGGFSLQDTEDALLTLSYLGIDNVLVLRGDAARNETAFEPEPGGHKYASELLRQVANLNAGIYLEDELKGTHKTDFCIGVAGYPEKHFEAPNMQTDMEYLRKKVEAGADYIVTQMFFDNTRFHAFVKGCREAGITVPIIPGLKPITTKKQLTVLPKTFYIDIPSDLSSEILKCKTDEEVEKVGEEWLLEQSRDLKKSGVPVLHYYTLGKPHVVANVARQL
jgi:methylenetetrahydrofolate reductase (NADPH)